MRIQTGVRGERAHWCRSDIPLSCLEAQSTSSPRTRPSRAPWTQARRAHDLRADSLRTGLCKVPLHGFDAPVLCTVQRIVRYCPIANAVIDHHRPHGCGITPIEVQDRARYRHLPITVQMGTGIAQHIRRAVQGRLAPFDHQQLPPSQLDTAWDRRQHRCRSASHRFDPLRF